MDSGSGVHPSTHSHRVSQVCWSDEEETSGLFSDEKKLSQYCLQLKDRPLKEVTSFIKQLTEQKEDIFHYLSPDARSACFERLFEHLKTLSVKECPYKMRLIAKLLESLPDERRIDFISCLQSSLDVDTKKLSDHLGAILLAKTFNDALSHLYSIEEVSPDFDGEFVEKVFDFPFREFRSDRLRSQDPEFTKRLRFNDTCQVFVFEDVMIGVAYTEPKKNPYLLAYRIKTEELLWGILLISPLGSRSHFFFERMDDSLLLWFFGETTIYLVDPKTGQMYPHYEISDAINNAYDKLHISSYGFFYQITHKEKERWLKSGIVEGRKLMSCLEDQECQGVFLPLSSHCGILNLTRRTLTLFLRDTSVILPECSAAFAKKDQLYSIEQRNHLVVRTLKSDNSVVSAPVKIISIDNSFIIFFGEMCDNGEIIFVVRKMEKLAFVFVNLQEGIVIESSHQIPSFGKWVINKFLGKVWTWDPDSQEIFEISSLDGTMRGKMGSGKNTSLLHVDKFGSLYFTPF